MSTRRTCMPSGGLVLEYRRFAVIVCPVGVILYAVFGIGERAGGTNRFEHRRLDIRAGRLLGFIRLIVVARIALLVRLVVGSDGYVFASPTTPAVGWK